MPRSSVVTFQGLCLRILLRAGRSIRIIAKREKEGLVAAAIRDLASKGQLAYFGSVADRMSLVSSLGRFIDELWQSGTDPAMFAKHATKPKEQDIAAIFDRYAALLDSAGAIDSAGAALAASACVEQSRVRLFSVVAADGFDTFSAVQVRLLTALSNHGVEVAAALTHEESRAVHLWREPTVARFREAGAQIEFVAATPASVMTLAASRLLAEDSQPPATSELPGTIVVTSAPDRVAEVRAVAREVKRLVLYEQYSPSQINLVCRSFEPYAEHLRWVFNEWGIPLTLERGRRLSAIPLGDSAIQLLTVHARDFPRRATMDLLRSAHFNVAHFGLDSVAIDLLDQLSLFYKVMRGREQWIEAIQAAVENKPNRLRGPAFSDYVELTVDELREHLALLSPGVMAVFDDLTPEKTNSRRAHCEWLLGKLQLFRVPDDDASDDGRVLQSLTDVIHDVSNKGWPVTELDERHDLHWDAFTIAVEQAIASSYLPPVMMPDSVIAQEVHRREARPFRAVFILGLIEGEFPARITETFPLTLSERDELRQAGIDLSESPHDSGYDLFQFHKTISQATERLYLSYSRTDLTGGELIRSYLIDEVKRVAPVQEIRIAHGEDLSDTALNQAGSLDELALLTAKAIRDGKGDSDVLDAACRVLHSNLASWSNTVRAASVERVRLDGAVPDKFDGIISDPEIAEGLREEFGPAHIWSATQINDYGTCPFRFFARHSLRLQSADEPVEGFLAQEIGAAYHRVLERVYSEIRREGIQVALDASQTELVDAERLTDVVERSAARVLDGMLESGEIRGGPLWEFEKKEIRRRIMKLLRAEAAWNRELPSTPLELERRFGIGDAAALIVSTREGDIRIRGVIDRIDRRSDGLVVIDYKTAASPISYRDAFEGRNLQLPIYLMAVEQVIRAGQPIASGYYLHIHSARKGSELRRGGGSEQAIGPVLNRSQDFIGEYTSQARGGQFPVRPNGPCPAYCEYKVMCRIQSLRAASSTREPK